MLRRNQDSKLGAGVPRHAAWLCRAAHLGKGGASPARCIPPEQRRATLHRQSGAPCSPIPPASGFRARHHDQTVRRLDAGNVVSRCIDNQESLAPPIPPASGFRARHHDQTVRRLDAGNVVPRCIDNQESLAPPIPPASGFRARHHDERRSASRHLTKLAPLGLAPACAAGPGQSEPAR